MLSIFAPHFFNWTEQLKDAGHEVYWLDIFDSKTDVPKIDFVHQITGWRYKWDFPGRYRIKENFPDLNRIINLVNERNLAQFFEKKLKEINPDVIHSFTIHLASIPIIEIIGKYPELKWICSSWGSDLFYYKDNFLYVRKIKKVLSRVDFLFVDCHRDYDIAVSLGFKGQLLGVIPGGGGIDFEKTDLLMLPFEDRKLILIKGYQGELGRCIEVLKAIEELKPLFLNFKIVVFGADQEVLDYVNKASIGNWKNFKISGKISNQEILKLMGKALVYIGNSISDGMPNTLLEAIVMGAFPVQSNPGGATAEIIQHGKNGLMIENPENVSEIKIILKQLFTEIQMDRAVNYNLENIKPLLEREKIKKEVVVCYKLVEKAVFNNVQKN